MKKAIISVLLSIGFVIAGMSSLSGADPIRRTVSALREGWFVKQLEPGLADPKALTAELAAPGKAWLAARMPAQVHDVLLAHKLIQDPHFGKNAADSAWVGEKDWAYGCRFPSPAAGSGPAFLRFDGLDTLATAYLNGTEIGRFRDMFIEYKVDVRPHLAPAGRDNVLLIVFSSPLKYLDALDKSPVKPDPAVGRSKYLRKSSGDFSSYLGARPHAVKVGVYRDVRLDVPAGSWIEDVRVRTELASGNRTAAIKTDVITGGREASLRWALKDPSGREVKAGESKAAREHRLEIPVSDPRLWWPWTHGEPALYDLTVEVASGKDAVDTRTVRVGLRDIRLVTKDPASGEARFRFDVNGVPIYLAGANWIPLEGMSHVWDSGRAATLIDLARHSHMNVFRVWGEGYVPPAEFYDECDRRGILVWQDFMFGYGPYPTGLADLDALYRQEAADMIVRLRNHPSLLLWCGGNENHMGWDFAGQKPPMPGQELFDKVLPAICAELDPTRAYHPSSPHGGPVSNWPLEGDWHDYSTLWFSPEASVPLFASEVGRVSVPSLRSMKNHMSEEDLWPKGFDPRIRVPGQAAWPPMWQYRSVGGSWDKIGPIEQYADPDSAESLIRVLGTAHGEYLRQRVERERRGIPDGAPAGPRRNWGNIIWRLNDCWPIIYWSAIDYYLEPKIAYYYLRRAYDPVQISFEKTADRIQAWVVNDSPRTVEGTLRVTHRKFSGKVVAELSAAAVLKPGEARRLLDLTPFGPISLREEFLQAEFAGREAIQLVFGEKYLHLPKAALTAKLAGDTIEIASDAFVRQVILTAEDVTGAVFEDNYFDLAPGGRRSVKILNAVGAARITVKGLNAEAVTLLRPPSK